MADRWAVFVRNAVRPETDDPHVRLLREKLRAGCRTVRINLLASESDAPPEVLVVLSCEAHLSEMRLPHSPSFFRWSLESGTALETPEEEARRFRLELERRLAPIAEELGTGYFDGLLVARVRELGMPCSTRRVEDSHPPLPRHDSTRVRAEARLDEVLVSLARDLGRSLRYSEEQTGDILDRAMDEYLDRRFHISSIREIFGR